MVKLHPFRQDGARKGGQPHDAEGDSTDLSGKVI